MVQERTEMKIENELRLWQLKRHQRTNAINYCLHLNQKKNFGNFYMAARSLSMMCNREAVLSMVLINND